MSNCNIYNSISIVIALDSIYNNLKTKILSLFKTDNKTIDKIQQIFCFAKAKKLNKKVTNNINNMAILFRKPQRYNKRCHNNYLLEKKKQKTNSDKLCFNCHKLGQYGRDYNQSD